MRAPTTAFLICTTIATVGCSQPVSPTSPTSARSSALVVATSNGDVNSASARHDLPFRGRLEATYTGSGEPPLVTVHVEGGGVASHLGRFTFDSTHVVNFLDLTGAGTAELTAANGDKLITNETGIATPQETPGVFLIVETLTVTGGTGRFAGATGQFVIERLSYPIGPANGTTSGSFEGTLSLPNDD